MAKTETYLKKIRQEFPNFSWNNYELVEQGWDHAVLIFDKNTVFRFPYPGEYRKAVKSEAKLLHYLGKRLTIPIPQYAYVAKDGSFAGYSMIAGSPLTKARYAKLAPTARETIARQLSQFLTELHAVSLVNARRLGVIDIDRSKDIKRWRHRVRQIYPSLSNAEATLIESYFDEFLTNIEYPQKVVTHNDLFDEHIILDPDRRRLSGIIDFSDRSIGDPAADFAGLWEFGPQFLKHVYHHYHGPKDDKLLYRSLLSYKVGSLDWMQDAWRKKAPVGMRLKRDFDYWRRTAIRNLRKNNQAQLNALARYHNHDLSS